MDNGLSRVDYDLVANTYNQRFTVDTVDPTGNALLSLVENYHAKTILEVGCGTGHWLTKLNNPDMTLYGADLSYGMLTQAESRAKQLHLVQTDAEILPFATNQFDLVYCVNAVHHFGDPRKFLTEAYSKLKPGGVLAIIGRDPHRNNDHWYVYEYFDHVYKNDLARFKPWKQLIEWMDASGFQKIREFPVGRIVGTKTGRDVFEDPYLQKNATSQLILLSNADYLGGIKNIRVALEDAEVQGQDLVFPVELTLELIFGLK